MAKTKATGPTLQPEPYNYIQPSLRLAPAHHVRGREAALASHQVRASEGCSLFSGQRKSLCGMALFVVVGVLHLVLEKFP